MLLLDGLVMTTERDEFIYHEMMVHPGINLHSHAPETALVIGGGDGGTVRELMRYNSLRKIVLCEIDSMVVEVSRQFLPGISTCLSSSNSRLEVVFQDGDMFLSDNRNVFDHIFVDSSDPAGAAEVLFSAGFYRKCFDSMRKDGILSVQSESPIYHLDLMARVREAMMEAGFADIRFCTAPVPSYPGGFWSWAVGRKSISNHLPSGRFFLSEEEFGKLKYVTQDLLTSCFILPAFIRKALR